MSEIAEWNVVFLYMK